MRQKLLSEAAELLVKNRRRRVWTKAVGCMAAVVVFCTTYALILPALTMEKDTVCGYVEHIHTEECYQPGTMDASDGNAVKVVSDGNALEGDEGTYCGIHAHQHTTECFGDSNPTADVETEEEWKASFADASLTGNWAQDLVAIAQSQIGYAESEDNFIYTEEKELKGYTRYGDWYGDEYGDWNAMFVAFCLNYAQVKDFPVEMDYTEWIAALIDANTEDYIIYHQDDNYTPSAGDLVFLDLTQDGIADDIGVVADLLAADNIEPARIQVIEGDCEDKVQTSAYALESTLVLGFADMTTAQEKYIANEALKYADGIKAVSVTATDKGAASVFEYEDENMAITLHVEGEIDFSEVSGGDAFVNDNTALLSQEDLWKEVRCKIRQLDDCGDEYYELAEYALENNGTDELYELKAYEFEFYYKNIELNIETLNVSAEITPNEDMLTAPEIALMTLASEEDAEEEETIAPEAEEGTVISILGKIGNEITGLNSVLLKSGENPNTLAVTLSSNVLAVTAAKTANPTFTVQYYAYIDTVKENVSGATELKIIDTGNGGNNKGGILPKNGAENVSTTKIKKVYLVSEDSSNTSKQLATESVLTEVFSEGTYNYHTAPNQTYFNRVYDNGSYTLDQIWILNEGKSKDSNAPEDWTIYLNPTEVHFTNRDQSTEDTTILIKDDTVIRLVYNSTLGTYNNAATFYDYDITDGKLYSAANELSSESQAKMDAEGKTIYAYTNQQGINSKDNYEETGCKLAFGNMNTGTDLGNIMWNGNYLNRYNAPLNGSNAPSLARKIGFEGCTFGLVSGLDKDGHIQYSDGITAPKLFNESGTVNGKTTIEGSLNSKFSLDFSRVGDTYTLSGVRETNATNLHIFGNPGGYTSIWTNNFWPMDSADTYGVTGHDLKFGDKSKENKRKFFDKKINNDDTFPPSDDGNVDHNSYFGLYYAVQFELADDYVGPLEYYFFGDDDMWLFISPADDNGTLQGKGTLVCDIGGIHSSVGQYVNLWDYIKKGSTGSYILSFFYTERGASGSTCFMRFTLPSVSSITPEHDTDSLRVEKTVEGVKSDEQFNFTIKLYDTNNNELKDDYVYTKYDYNGYVIGNDLILHDGGTFSLKHGEYIIINYLPDGTKYTITENVPDGFHASVKESSGTIKAGNTATGTIVTDTTGVVKYINTASYALPHTGGSGTQWYALAGITLLLSAAYLMYRRKKYA